MRQVSNVGRWDWYYRHRDTGKPFGYSPSVAFRVGADWLADCATVADWGCGGGLLREHVPSTRYVGVDGSHTSAVDVVADLEVYRMPSDGVFMRNVLEHNEQWEQVLTNALAAFRQRMVLVLFTPWHDGPDDAHLIQFEKRYEVPTYSFRRDAIESRLDAAGVSWKLVTIEAESVFGVEHIFLIEK